MKKPTLVVFASGDALSGGSGFENLFLATQAGVLDAQISCVVSHCGDGEVRKRASRLGVPFVHFPAPWDAESYQRIVKNSGAEWTALSGWLKLVRGLDPKKTFNIHPALLSQLNGRFGGKGMYGRHVHEKVKRALDDGEISDSGFTMHFVTDEYDRGPVFAEIKVPLHRDMTAEEIQRTVNAAEHRFQPMLTDLVVHNEITWDGKDPASLFVPENLQKKIWM